MISQRGILKAFGSSFFDNALHTFQQKGLSKNFFQNLHVVQALFSHDTINWIAFVLQL